MSFEQLGLRAELLRSLAEAGYSTPTPVQAQAIPVIMEGRDILAGAQTGTGKTAGFTLPMLHRLADPENVPKVNRRVVRALILVPTRELAAQVQESVRNYGRYLRLSSTVIFGGVNINPQFMALRRGVDILVATPGRLLDHVSQRTVDLSNVEILVLDEADRMLDMGFIPDIRRIVALLPEERQSLLFSATFTDEIRQLADRFLTNPVNVEVARKSAESDLITQCCYPCPHSQKRDLLVHLIKTENMQQALVFTRTKHGADRLAKQLERDGITTAVIHGRRSQPQRMKALADFKRGASRILVATDIAARGLDIDQLPHVINYELPNVPEDYVHRIGRTGRAGSEGHAISLVSHDERGFLMDIERLLKKRIERREAEGFVPVQRAPEVFEPEESTSFSPRPSPRPYNSGPRPGGSGQRNYGAPAQAPQPINRAERRAQSSASANRKARQYSRPNSNE